MSGPGTVAELLRSGASVLDTYCNPNSRYAWPAYDVDISPKKLIPQDLRWPAFLSVPIRRGYFERMLYTLSKITGRVKMIGPNKTN